jgi:hypothetical protein
MNDARTTTMTTNLLALAPNAVHYVFNQWRQAWRTSITAKTQSGSRGLADELASVRALADSYRRTDPGFASDLYAAADRHERAFEEAQGR